MNYDFDQARATHARHIQAGLPVLPWDEFEALARDVIAADEELRTAIIAASDLLQAMVGDGLRWPGWQFSASSEALEVSELMSSDNLPVQAHPSDLSWQLTYGRSRRNPAAQMRRRAREIRKVAIRIRTEIERFRLSGSSVR